MLFNTVLPKHGSWLPQAIASYTKAFASLRHNFVVHITNTFGFNQIKTNKVYWMLFGPLMVWGPGVGIHFSHNHTQKAGSPKLQKHKPGFELYLWEISFIVAIVFLYFSFILGWD